MTFNRALMLVTLFAACSMHASAQKEATPAADGAVAKSNPVLIPALTPEDKKMLAPRQPIPKPKNILRGSPDAMLIVKFRDEVKARIQPDRSVAFTASGLRSADLDAVEVTRIKSQYNLQFVSASANIPQETIDRVTAKAELRSGKAQPDLRGYMFVDGPDHSLVAAANDLSRLESVEFAYFENSWRPFPLQDQNITPPARLPGNLPAPTAQSAPRGGPIVGACCLPSSACLDGLTEADCDAQGGLFVEGTDCASLPEPGCPPPIACCIYVGDDWCVEIAPFACANAGGVNRGGDPDDPCTGEACDFQCGTEDAPSCFVPHLIPACDEDDGGECCEIVGAVRSFCIEEEPPNEPGPGIWDDLCVAIAHMWCPTPPADRCLAGVLNESCFQAHGWQGCNDPVCCAAVCEVAPECCFSVWDQACANAAVQLCSGPPDNVATPDFVAYQGYLRSSPYENQLGGYPPPPMPAPPTFPPTLPGYFAPPRGFGGEGYDLFGEGGPPSRLWDDPAMSAPDRFEGAFGLGRELHEIYGIGSSNQARGAGVKVGIIEWSCYQFHEDLNVVVEPGQTLITTYNDLNNHATACIGIIGAKNDGKGLVGIAPDAQTWFFPLTSVEEGPRMMAAFVNCYDMLDPGDIVSCSFGPPPGNLNTSAFSHSLITMGTDMGIITCVAAGNSCANLDDFDDNGDSGAIVVGACTPGSPWCRLTFSNYSRTVPPGHSSRIVCCAWGTWVASPGYGDLFSPDGNPNRSYSVSFGGTSAATPQVAGMLACAQGMAKQFYGIPLTPGQLRGAIGGTPQCRISNPADLPGFSQDLACGQDTDPDAEGNRIGPYATPGATCRNILTQGNGFGSSQVTDVFILRGNLAFGNLFSVKSSDNSYLTVQSLYTKRNHKVILNSGNAEANFVASRVRYQATGYTADVMVRAKAPASQSGGIGIQVIGEIMNPDPIAMVFFELYDWMAGKWMFVGVDTLPQSGPGGELAFAHDIGDGRRFINPNTKSTYLRAYVLASGPSTPGGGNPGPNGGQTGATGSTFRFDWLNVQFTGGGEPVP